MSMLALKIVTAVLTSFVFDVVHVQSIITTPTSGNATHQYFDTSINISYASDTIICNTSYCHITCNELNSCKKATIDASLSSTLIIECPQQSSCEDFNIFDGKGPSTYFNLYCGGYRSCYSAFLGGITTTTNIDIICNYTTTTYSNGACYAASIRGNQATTINIHCYGENSCYGAYINAMNVDGSVNLNCHSIDSCESTKLEATNMAISSSVNVICDTGSMEQYVCKDLEVICPINGICNIDCLSTDACYSALFSIPNEDYNTFNLNCNNAVNDACYSTNILCTETSNQYVSQLSYMAYEASIWRCGTFNCCPWREGYHSCSSQSDCTISCNGLNCRNTIINGSLANSLTVNCGATGGTTCVGTLILCPFGDNTTCIIDCNGMWCDYIEIRGGTDNKMDLMQIDCNNGGTISGCKGADIRLSSASINTVNIKCGNNGYCGDAVFRADNTIINNFIMNCDDCEDIAVYAKIGASATINCENSRSCYRSKLTLRSASSSDVNYMINCLASTITTSTSNAACYAAKMYLYGQQNNNLTLNCGQYDCYDIDVYAYNLNTVNAACSTPYACNKAMLNLDSLTEILKLNCSGDYSCKDSIVYCPYREANSCQIVCSEQVQTCYNMQIQVLDGYIWSYLDLECASETVHPDSDSCVGLNVNCPASGQREKAIYVWDTADQNYQCNKTGATVCCPIYQTGDNIGSCQSGSDCNMDCSTNSCDAKIIDGSDANYLTVTCGPFDCRYTAMYCPNGGCNISCSGNSSCEYASIIYTGTQSDNGRVNINVEGYYAFRGAVIDADSVDEIKLSCIGRTNFIDYVCYGIQFRANYANNVIINAMEEAAIHNTKQTDDEWWLQYVKSVTVNSWGYRAIKTDYKRIIVHLENTQYVQINMAADRYNQYSQTGGMTWSIGFGLTESSIFDEISRNMSINCFGYGCYKDLGWIDRGDIIETSQVELNINSCAICNIIGSTQDCIREFRLYCDADTTVDEYDAYFYNTRCGSSTYNDCGCMDLIDNKELITNSNADGCYTPPTEAPTTAFPTSVPTTSEPTTANPTTFNPTTRNPTTANPTTLFPTTSKPTTSIPTTLEPTTLEPTSSTPTTMIPTTFDPTSAFPTTYNPTTMIPTTTNPTTNEPTTTEPTTNEPTTATPTTYNPTNGITTDEPTTDEPTSYLTTSSSLTSISTTKQNNTIIIKQAETEDTKNTEFNDSRAALISTTIILIQLIVAIIMLE